MAEILIAAMSAVGHVGPLMTIARDLIDRGDNVTFVTGARHDETLLAMGAATHPLLPAYDMPDSALDLDLPGREETSGIARINFDLISVFVRPMRHQAAVLSKVLAERQFDAIIADATFFGILPFLLGERGAHPPVLIYCTTPLLVSGRDIAPPGMGLPPATTRLGRARHRALNVLSRRVLLRPAQQAANYQLDRMNSRRLPMFLMDAALLADRYISPTVPEFEYPRGDMPANVRFVGAVQPAASQGFQPPPWWSLLDSDRPVVHVTQGTVDNADLGRLLEPTIDALAGEDVIVVATTGGRPVSEVNVKLPSNTFVAEFLPHDMLLPKVDVMVTNGGYGAVQRALATGVPLVVAGDTEDKPEVAARVAWAGTGVNMRTGTPTPGAIRSAVRDVLNDESYLRRAQAMEVAFARRDGVAEISAMVDEVIAEHRAVVDAPPSRGSTR